VKKAVAIILIVLLLLSAITYAVGYGYDLQKHGSSQYSSERRAHIVELYLKKRDGPNVSGIIDAWNSLATPRLSQSKDEVLHLWRSILERVSEL